MLKQLYQTLSGDNQRVISNIFSLGVLQAANYIFPLITAPYLIRILGPEYYGLIAFSAATITYFALMTDYGFNLSATRQVALARDNPDRLSSIFNSVMIVKLGLAILSLILLSILLMSIERFGAHSALYYITFLIVIGQMLFPVWFFQGMETMKYITYINVASKAFFTVAVFLFVKDQTDYLLVPLFTGAGAILSGVWTLIFIRKQFDIKFAWQPLHALKVQLIDGWHVFLSTLIMSLYTSSTTFMLGLFTNNTTVGYFAAADKVILAAKGLFTPVVQAMYPMLSKKVQTDTKGAMQLVKKVSAGMGVYTLLISIGIYLFAQPIVTILFGEGYEASVSILTIMAGLPVLIALSNIFGLLVMLNTGHKKAFTVILSIAAAIGLSLCLLLIPTYAADGAAMVMVAVELLITLSMFAYLKFKKIF